MQKQIKEGQVLFWWGWSSSFSFDSKLYRHKYNINNSSYTHWYLQAPIVSTISNLSFPIHTLIFCTNKYLYMHFLPLIKNSNKVYLKQKHSATENTQNE
jgi:hypothetical protein